MFTAMKKRRGRSSEAPDVAVQIAFDSRVSEYIVAELEKSPTVEEGGKYVGYILRPGDPRQRTLDLDDSCPSLLITDFLPSGPNAVRTAVELQPDGPYQEQLFRQIERLDPDVEHLGTWHSHHCNGLRTLSEGDIDGYIRTVNKPQYRPDYFVASLVTRLPHGSRDEGWIDHFLFCRGRGEYYRITDSIRTVNCPTSFGGVIDHGQMAAVTERGRSSESGEPHQVLLSPPSRRPEGPWYQTPEGRSVLADDKRFLSSRFHERLVATRKGDTITMTGHCGGTTLVATYPSDSAAQDIVVVVANEGSPVLQIKADLSHRELAFLAGIAAVETLKSSVSGRRNRPI